MKAGRCLCFLATDLLWSLDSKQPQLLSRPETAREAPRLLTGPCDRCTRQRAVDITEEVCDTSAIETAEEI